MRDCDFDQVCLHDCGGNPEYGCTGDRLVQVKGSTYKRADGAPGIITIVDDTTYADVDDVVIRDEQGDERRIDSFKLWCQYEALNQSFRKV